MRPRARAIANHCRRPGAFLTAVHVKRGREFYLQPGARRVRTGYALEAIQNGWLIAKDTGLFGDDPQVWVCPSQPTNTHDESLARDPSASHSKSAAETKKMDVRKYLGVMFVPLEVLQASGPQQKEIEATEEGKYGKLNLIFTDRSAVSLNATNLRTLVEAFGFETANWPGHSVELAAGELKYDGKFNPAILIAPLESASVEKPSSMPRSDGMDSDIPF
jgi:hypothetical protein